ncbi:MAG: hypothetical protein NVV68_17510 [Dokdonella sp.]|nr:hypothetical protein [Dokdonella sp.]
MRDWIAWICGVWILMSGVCACALEISRSSIIAPGGLRSGCGSGSGCCCGSFGRGSGTSPNTLPTNCSAAFSAAAAGK